MNIGIDIDNVISNFNEVLLKEYIEYDKTLRNSGIINDAEYITRGMFDFTEEENRYFYTNNIERIAESLEPIIGAKKYIDKLIDDGNKVYIITGRDNGDYKNPKEMTKRWLEKYEINYHKLIFTDSNDVHSKTYECIKNKIDVMIDDSSRICEDIHKGGIKVFLMDTEYNRKNSTIERVTSWEEIYAKISNFSKKKINVILDTDTYNETDDQFALSYLLKSQNICNIEAITIAPFKNDRLFEDSGINRSFDEAKKVCKLCGIDSDNLIFKGSTDYIKNGYDKKNDAVNKIIEVSLKNDKTYILAIGAITNVALALKYEPQIADKIEIIWLGGHTLLNSNNLHEANFKDVDAIKIVFNSNVKLTIIPCIGVASNLYTTIPELSYYLKGKSKLCDFLFNTFEEYINSKNYTRWPLWDIAVIAYIVNKDWFETFEVNCPDIGKNTSYILNKSNRKITMVNYINVDEVFKDLYSKLLDLK